ncbi:MAG: hypothetical protein AABW51_05405 [Nanoarchaeota archaeon]
MDDKWHDPRNRLCEKYINGEIDVLAYLTALRDYNILEVSQKGKGHLLEIHQHLKKCKICMDCYIFLKERFSSDERNEGDEFFRFTPEAFRLISENERTLDKLVASSPQ